MTRGAMSSRLNEQGRGSFNRVGIAPRVSALPNAKDAFRATFAEQRRLRRFGTINLITNDLMPN